MNKNPYDVLEIPQTASNDEVKRAYRELSRKYHPDSYVNNPLSDLAEEKFKDVQEAYQVIMKEREQGYGGGYQGSNSYNSSSSSSSYNNQNNYSYGDVQELNNVVNFINARRYADALNLLHRIPNRTSRWYYCSAVANHGMGNVIIAQDHAKQALNMEPNNREYISLVNQLNWQGQRYQNTRYGGNQTFGTGNLCCDLWCADTLCECMGGDLCSCM